MKRRQRKNGLSGAVLALALCTLSALTAPASAQVEEPLGLALNNAVALPGGLAAIVLRTYASRGVGQGQICLGFRAANRQAGAAVSPVDSITGAVVFNTGTGGTFSAEIVDNGGEPALMLNFDSPEGSVNLRDGPLAVIYVRLIGGLVPDQRFDVELDVAATFLNDPNGSPIPLDLRAGRLDITSVAAPFEIAAAAEPAVPGSAAFLSVQTGQLRLLSGGHVVFRYNPDIAVAPPAVYVDARYGNAAIDTSGSVPEAGILSVQFVSPQDNLNRVVGDIISIRLPTRPGIPPGTNSPIWLDASQTFLVDRAGRVLSLAYESDVVRFR